jgi:hypothetical protein
MHTIRLDIDDTIFDKFMVFLELLPKDKVSVTQEYDTPSISFEEAELKVKNAVNNISSKSGISLDEAIHQVTKA